MRIEDVALVFILQKPTQSVSGGRLRRVFPPAVEPCRVDIDAPIV